MKSLEPTPARSKAAPTPRGPGATSASREPAIAAAIMKSAVLAPACAPAEPAQVSAASPPVSQEAVYMEVEAPKAILTKDALRCSDPDEVVADTFLEHYLVDDCILDVVFDLVRSIKSAESPIHELCVPSRRLAATTQQDTDLGEHAAFCGIAREIAAHQVEAPHCMCLICTCPVVKEGSMIFESLAAFREPKGEFRCAHCGQKVSALRYAPHLDKCMGKGRSRRLGAGTRKS